MKQDAGTFQFALSRAELHWLAGALGIARLPLPDSSPVGLSPSQLESQQKNGHASLLTRGLIRPSPGFGWQVERLPAALLQWISSTPSLLRLEHISKEGTSRRSHLLTAGKQGLLLQMDSDTARFVIYESLPLLQDAALRWLALPTKISKSRIACELPQPITFLPAAWNDTSLAARILKERGIEAKSAFDWVASLEWVAALTQVKLEGRDNSIINQFVICGDKKSIWGGDEMETNVSFVPMTVKQISAKIAKTLE